MTTPGPKEMQPWIREVNQSIKRLEQNSKVLNSKLSKPRLVRPYAEDLSNGYSVTGVQAGYTRVGIINNGPEVQTFVPGPVLVTVAVHLRAVWGNTAAAAAAYAGVGVAVDGAIPAAEDASRYWIHDTFQFRVGDNVSEISRTLSVSRPVVVGRGDHSFRIVYFTKHLTTQIYIGFSKRSIMVEAI